jgi:putative phosphoesterase
MKVAIFSDIHGNAVALEAVLRDIEAQQPDRIVCGGDLAFGGPQPQEAVDRARGLGIPCVRGNTDEWFVDDGHAAADPISEWTRARLNAASRQWLAGLPFDHRIDDLLIVHATPWSISELVPKDADQSLLQRVLGEARAAVVVYGHIHIAWIGHVPGTGIVVNTGSVGVPFDGDPRGAYAVLEQAASGWTAELRRVSYDVERTVSMFPADHPDPDTWARRIRTGRR